MMAVNSHNGIEQSDLMPTESGGVSIQTATTIGLTLTALYTVADRCTQRSTNTIITQTVNFYQFLLAVVLSVSCICSRV